MSYAAEVEIVVVAAGEVPKKWDSNSVNTIIFVLLLFLHFPSLDFEKGAKK